MELNYCGICVECSNGTDAPQVIMIGREKGLSNARRRVEHLAAALRCAEAEAMNYNDESCPGIMEPETNVTRVFFVAGPDNKTFYESYITPESKTEWTDATPEEKTQHFEMIADLGEEIAKNAKEAAREAGTASPKRIAARLRYQNATAQILIEVITGSKGHPVDE